MQFTRHENVQDFAACALPQLEKNEVENNLPIGLLKRALEGKMGTDDWFMASVQGGHEIDRLFALMTPPHNIILSAANGDVSDDAMDCLISELQRMKLDVPGTVGKSEIAYAFARRYTAQMGLSFHTSLHERVYQLTKVASVPKKGCFRSSSETDMAFLPYWLKASYEDCFGISAELDGEAAQKIIESGNLFILEAGGCPVSMAGAVRKTAHGSVIGHVYTPPYFRGHGYAKSCVASLSQHLLDKGEEYCALFADLANPISNRVYQDVGYCTVCDFDELVFDKA